ncbi:MAG: AMP-binding protein, partial [Lachnospiraceae bacterium]|nr:AMP-binding protein [Lachnospiraceae bacterium]
MEDYNKIYFMDRFNKTVTETPNNRVLVDAFHPEGYTRKELDELSGKVYTYLKENGVGRNDFVMIYMPRTVDIFVAALGVLKAGAFFTIMEDHYPRERVEFMKQNANCKLELNADTLKEAYTKDITEGFEVCDLHDPAFIIFTSGSTGNPKGIIHEYGNIGHIMDSVVYPDCEGMKEFGLVAPTNFIATILLYMVALSDETIDIHLLSYDIVKNPKKLAEYVVTKGVTHTFVSPSMMRVTNNLIGLPLKLIITGSEPATNVYNPNTPVMNFYCMSESGFCISQFIIDKPYKNCPIGKCETGAHEILLLKEDGTKVTEQGDIGEICVTNPYVRGYIGLPDETRKTFVDGIMHTNDLGRFDENGNLVYVGRANDMVKINGNRIEPAEIEAVGKEVLGIDWCAA